MPGVHFEATVHLLWWQCVGFHVFSGRQGRRDEMQSRALEPSRDFQATSLGYVDRARAAFLA
jgi:hypothetical protein